MSDLNEKLGATEEQDFEGHKLGAPEKLGGKLGGRIADISDEKIAANDEPDFEGHKFGAPERLAEITDVKA